MWNMKKPTEHEQRLLKAAHGGFVDWMIFGALMLNLFLTVFVFIYFIALLVDK